MPDTNPVPDNTSTVSPDGQNGDNQTDPTSTTPNNTDPDNTGGDDDDKFSYLAGLSPEEQVAKLKEVSSQAIGRAKRAEDKLKTKTEPQPAPNPKPNNTPPTGDKTYNVLDESKTYAELLNEGFSPEDIATFAKYRRDGQTLRDVIKDPIIKAGVEQEIARRKADNATPSPSTAGVLSNGKTWEQMSEGEKEANWQEKVKKSIAKGKGRF